MGQWMRQMLHSEVNDFHFYNQTHIQICNIFKTNQEHETIVKASERVFANAMVDVTASPCVFKCSQWPWWTRWCEGAALARVLHATHETCRLFCRCPSVQSQSPSAWELLFLFTNTLVTSVETIRLLNPEPAIGCASAAIIGRFVAITHRKQSLADLMTVFGCRGWRRMTATGNSKGLNNNEMIPSGCRLIF